MCWSNTVRRFSSLYDSWQFLLKQGLYNILYSIEGQDTFQSQRINQTKNVESEWLAELDVYFESFFDTEDRGDMFFRKIYSLWTDYKALIFRR
jgi:hypothetical protein